MKNNNNINELKKVFQKRNFYTLKDSANIFLYALLLPLAVGIVFSYITIAVARNLKLEVGEGENLSIFLIENNYLGYIIPSLLLTQVVFLCVYLAYHKIDRISFRATKLSLKKANIWTSLLSVFVGIVCVLGFVWLIEGCFGNFFQKIGISTSPEIPVENVGMLFVYLLVLGVVPAIVEELLFRGVIFQGLRSRFSRVASVLLCAALFALMHQNIEQLIYPFLLGCVLSLVMEKTGNLLYCIIIHMFNNLSTIILSYIVNTVLGKQIADILPITWWGVLCAILIAAATIAVLWLIYHFYLKKIDAEDLQEEENLTIKKKKSFFTKPQKLELEKEGEINQTPPVMAGKLPLTMVVGIVIALIFLVINAI